MLIISAHADTNFLAHKLMHLGDGKVKGELDNFAGVYCVMQAYMSGQMAFDYIRLELTHGEEVDFAGAKEVRSTMNKNDMVVVLDVTGVPISKGFTIEKCKDPSVRQFLEEALEGLPYDLYEDCPDPIANQDETDIYRKRTPYTFFLGVPVTGGDYNNGPVTASLETFEYVKQALIRLAQNYPKFVEMNGGAGKLTAPMYLKPEEPEPFRMCSYCLISLDDQAHFTCCEKECGIEFALCEDCESEGRLVGNHELSHATMYHPGDNSEDYSSSED